MSLKLFVQIVWIQMAWLSTQQLEQSPLFLSIREGEDVTVYCNSSSVLPTFQWYKQEPGKGPVLLMTMAKGGEVKKEKRLTVQLGDTRKYSSLHITATQPGDEGNYICAGTQCSQGTCCLYPNPTAGPTHITATCFQPLPNTPLGMNNDKKFSLSWGLPFWTFLTFSREEDPSTIRQVSGNVAQNQ